MARNGVSTSLRRAAGDVLICGLGGTALSTVEAAWLRLIRPAGIILFRRNLESPKQTRRLLQAAADASGADDLLRIVDLEGGTVDRLRDLVSPIPSPESVGETHDAAAFVTHGRLIARGARLFGFNTTFAPVLDLKTAVSAKVMRGRTASSDPVEVTDYAAGFLRGLAEEGVLGCGKHFPGLGSGKVDSHQVTPRIDEPFSVLWDRDIVPYRRLAGHLPMVMISHARYPKTRSQMEPSSVSRFWTSDVLRKKIGFRGLIVTDDMEMGGILSHSGLGEAVVETLTAGAHLIEICHDPARILCAYEALLTKAERSDAFAWRLKDSAAHSRSMRRKLLRRLPPFTPELGVARLRREISRFSKSLSQSNRGAARS